MKIVISGTAAVSVAVVAFCALASEAGRAEAAEAKEPSSVAFNAGADSSSARRKVRTATRCATASARGAS